MSLLPNAMERDYLEFYVAKKMPYNKRMPWIAALLVCGIVLQVLLPGIFSVLGLLPLGVAAALQLAVGYSNKPRGVPDEGQWKSASPTTLAEIMQLHRRSRTWDRSALDISNPMGFFTALGLGFLVFVGFVFIMLESSRWAWQAIFTAALVFLPIWFSGMRTNFDNAPLIEKLRVVQDLMNHFEREHQQGEKIQPSLKQAAVGGKSMPVDIRLQIKWERAGEQFYGVQTQVNINVVQGKRYPYCYFVVVGKRGIGLKRIISGVKSPKNTTIECEVQGDVEIIVVRQSTSRTSGYHTPPRRCRELMTTVLELGRRTAQAHPAPRSTGPPAPG
jgi:hypothetical protein